MVDVRQVSVALFVGAGLQDNGRVIHQIGMLRSEGNVSTKIQTHLIPGKRNASADLKIRRKLALRSEEDLLCLHVVCNLAFGVTAAASVPSSNTLC